MFENNNTTSINPQAGICIFNSTSSSSASSYTPTYEQLTEHMWNYDIVQNHMEHGTIQCYDIDLAFDFRKDFRSKVALYSEPEFRVNQFIEDCSFLLLLGEITDH